MGGAEYKRKILEFSVDAQSLHVVSKLKESRAKSMEKKIEDKAQEEQF